MIISRCCLFNDLSVATSGDEDAAWCRSTDACSTARMVMTPNMKMKQCTKAKTKVVKLPMLCWLNQSQLCSPNPNVAPKSLANHVRMFSPSDKR